MKDSNLDCGRCVGISKNVARAMTNERRKEMRRAFKLLHKLRGAVLATRDAAADLKQVLVRQLKYRFCERPGTDHRAFLSFVA
jgi:hypothetical protein